MVGTISEDGESPESNLFESLFADQPGTLQLMNLLMASGRMRGIYGGPIPEVSSPPHGEQDSEEMAAVVERFNGLTPLDRHTLIRHYETAISAEAERFFSARFSFQMPRPEGLHGPMPLVPPQLIPVIGSQFCMLISYGKFSCNQFPPPDISLEGIDFSRGSYLYPQYCIPAVEIYNSLGVAERCLVQIYVRDLQAYGDQMSA